MIAGAGLAGMLAAFSFPREEVYEARSREHIEHQALLRFRSSAVSDLTGIPFRRAIVHKGIWYRGAFLPPSIDLSNMYALKTIGRFADRSIWDIAPCERWVPPVDFHERMCDTLAPRIRWGRAIEMAELSAHPREELVISTLPLSILAPALLGISAPFNSAQIITSRTRIPNSDVFQTVYFPDPEYGLYRASILGEQLICEWTFGNDRKELYDLACRELGAAFGSARITDAALNSFGELHAQKYGKLVPIEEQLRKTLVASITDKYHIFSLGRFATWRNIMLDDVVHDIAVIKRLAEASVYERRLMAH